ncbi:hypothetical protein [Photobacterium swingsii]|nr:hypothetical protein [Photobacterium swingsii]
MDTIFSDTLTADLEHLDRTNRLLQTLPNDARAKLNMKVVDHIHLFPSQSFEPLAQDNYCYLPPMTRALMRMIGISPQDDAAITSYILFEPSYIKSLIQLGYEDALSQEVKLRNFLK